MSEITAMQKIEEALDPLDQDAKKRVLNWACARYIEMPSTSTNTPKHDMLHVKSGRGKGKIENPRKRKSKSIPKLIKSLSFNPKGKQSAKDFAAEKNPTNARAKGVLAVYYCRDILEIDSVSVNHVFSFFKAVGWPIPSDLINTLQQAGSAGWLDTADSQNILITSMGENLIEHDLPSS